MARLSDIASLDSLYGCSERYSRDNFTYAPPSFCSIGGVVKVYEYNSRRAKVR